MERAEYYRMFEAETNHWWYVSLRSLLEREVGAFFHTRKHPTALDAGCGTGAHLELLHRCGYAAIGFDISHVALNLAAQRTTQATLCQASADHFPFRTSAFDLVLLSDVLYHQNVANDRKVLQEICSVLKPGGLVILHTCAFECLRGTHDTLVHTARRYTVHQIREIVESTGLAVLKLSYRHALLFPVLFLYRHLHTSHNEGSDLKPISSWLNRLMIRLMALETALLRMCSLPLGTSIYCVAQRKEAD